MFKRKINTTIPFLLLLLTVLLFRCHPAPAAECNYKNGEKQNDSWFHITHG